LYFHVNTRELFAFALDGNDVQEALVPDMTKHLETSLVAQENRLTVTQWMRMNAD